MAEHSRRDSLLLLVLAAILIGGMPLDAAGVDPAPPATPPAQAPPIPPPGLLAEPRSFNQIGLPPEATQKAIPPNAPLTLERIKLGMKLFFDGRLSADGTVACATCHDPARAFTDGRPASIGIHGRVGQRNSPTILNALYEQFQFWDGRAKTLEEQAALPIVNPVEMGDATLATAVTNIAVIREYQQDFATAFGEPVNGTNLLLALATYERTLVSFDAPFDHYLAGESNAIDAAAKRGWELFNTKARCNKCHALDEKKRDSTFFMDNDFHNIGIGIIRHQVVPLARQAEREVVSNGVFAVDQASVATEFSVLGRFLITGRQADIASFKTPNLRNILVTAPYFHDGSQATLWDVLDHYNKGGGTHDPWLDEDMQPLALTDPEIDDVVAFLASLTSPEYQALGKQEWARQRASAQLSRPQRNSKQAFGPKPLRPAFPDILTNGASQ